MSHMFVRDTKHQELNPVPPGRARILLTQGKAAVWKRYPFTIILKTAVEAPVLEPLRIKIDPGSKTTGLALVNDVSGQAKPKAQKFVKGFQTGDLVRAVVTSGMKVGIYVGRVAVRSSRSFNIATKQGTVQGISHRFCTPIHRGDGYSYA